MTETTIKISERQRLCLELLARYYHRESCYYSRFVASQTGLPQNKALNALRALSRKKLVVLERGLIDEDGMLAGSGWRCSTLGKDFIDPEDKLEPEDDDKYDF